MMDFGQALHMLRNGGRVRRSSWNDGMVLYLVPGSKFAVNREPLLSILGEGTQINYRPHIDMLMPASRVGDGSAAESCVWQITQEAVFAVDWEAAPVAKRLTIQLYDRNDNPLEMIDEMTEGGAKLMDAAWSAQRSDGVWVKDRNTM